MPKCGNPVGGLHDAIESEFPGLGHAAVRVGDVAQLAGEAELAEGGDRPVGGR